MRRNNRLLQGAEFILTIALAAMPLAATASDASDKSRFSDQPAPLQVDDFPERPRPLLELGDKFLSTGNLQNGFTLPTGAVWTPNLWVFGTHRSAVQTFDPGKAPRTSEWANRLDIYANLYLSPTERIVAGWRPFDKDGMKFSGYNFEPHSTRGFQEAFSGTPRTLFFEGEFGEIFPRLDRADRLNLDYSFAVGRQPLTLQDGILANDNSIDMVSVTRNALRIPGGSTLRLSPFLAWSQMERPDSVLDANDRDKKALMFGLDSAADFPKSTVEADLVYVSSTDHSDGLYAGLGAIQRIGKFNTTFRVNTSVPLEKSSAKIGHGTLLFSEISYTMPYGVDIVYLNSFWGIDEYTSAVRDPTAGGPLGRVGILNAAVGLGRYGAPLSNQADDAAGGAIGYQMFFGELRRRQLILEIGGRAPTETPVLLRQQAAEGIGARFQQAFGLRYILVLDAFGVHRHTSSVSYGGRMELVVKF